MTKTQAPLFLGIGEVSDGQYNLVIERLRQDGVRLVSIDINAPSDLALLIHHDGTYEIKTNGVPIEPSTFWYRLKFLNVPLRSVLSHDYNGVIRTEWLAFTSSLTSILRGSALHTESMTPVGGKLVQLTLAGRAGFVVPETLAGLGKAEALDFVRAHDRVIIKGLHAARILRLDDPDITDALITTGLDVEAIESAEEDEFTACPYFLQQRLDNAREHRVIAFGDQVYCYRLVDAQGVAPLVDRRIMMPMFELVEPPPQLPALIARFFELADLRYGAFDLIFRDEEIVFLECNPEGQWHSANHSNLDEVIGAFARWAAPATAETST